MQEFVVPASRAIPRPERPWLPWLQAFVIIAAVLWTMGAALPGDWGGDDELYLIHNPLQYDPHHLWKIWFAPSSFIEYYPITETLQMLQWHLWGDDPSGYVWTNIVLHAVNALLVWRLLRHLGLRQGWLGGLLFAVHPLNVASVAWISEFKNTLSTAPFLLAMTAWIDFEQTRRRGDYGRALGFFLAAMLCKIALAPFAVVILLFAWWKRGRLAWSDLAASAPFFMISLVLGWLTYYSGAHFSQRHGDPPEPILLQGYAAHFVLAGWSSALYFAKFFWPYPPAPYYNRWNVEPLAFWKWTPWLVFAGILYVCWRRRRSWGATVLLGLGYFLLMLGIVLGVHEISFMRDTWVMDHFTYVPMIGLIALVVAAWEDLTRKAPRLYPWLVGAWVVVLAACTWETHNYAGIYSSRVSLFVYNLAVTPNSAAVHDNLGLAFLRRNDLPDAIDQYRDTVEMEPGAAGPHLELGSVLLQSRRPSEAEEEFRAALQLAPNLAAGHTNLAFALLELDRTPEAEAELRRSLAIFDLPQSRNGLGQLLYRTHRPDAAEAEFRRALELDPDQPQILDNLGYSLCAQHKFAEARPFFQQALSLDPHDKVAQAALEQMSGQ
jgi:Flp pilus assembly protein TadD